MHADLRVEDAGQVILVKCNSIIIENLNFSHTDVGIELWQTKNARIANNSIKNNRYSGIMLLDSSNNNIAGNNITKDNIGVSLDGSSNFNTVSGNNIANNNVGLGLYGWPPKGNSIYHNNFINNTEQAYNQRSNSDLSHRCSLHLSGSIHRLDSTI